MMKKLAGYQELKNKSQTSAETDGSTISSSTGGSDSTLETDLSSNSAMNLISHPLEPVTQTSITVSKSEEGGNVPSDSQSSEAAPGAPKDLRQKLLEKAGKGAKKPAHNVPAPVTPRSEGEGTPSRNLTTISESSASKSPGKGTSGSSTASETPVSAPTTPKVKKNESETKQKAAKASTPTKAAKPPTNANVTIPIITTTPEKPEKPDKEKSLDKKKEDPEKPASEKAVSDKDKAKAAPQPETSEQTTAENRILSLSQKGEWALMEQALRTLEPGSAMPSLASLATGETPLMLACKDSKLVIVERLIEHGVNVHTKTKDGRTALHFAAQYSKEEIIKLLLSRKADPNVVGGVKQQLPLHFACNRPQPSPQVVQALLKATKNGRLQQDKDGVIPIMLAAETGSPQIIRDLLEKDAEAQLKTHKKSDGDTALHITARRKDLELMRIMCENGAPCNAPNFMGHTVLHISSQEGDDSAVKLLHKFGAAGNVVDKNDRNPLHMAAERGQTRVVEYLIDRYKSNVLARTKDGSTLMHVTSEHGYPDTTLAFLKRGVPLHMPNKDGALCLHAAAKRGHVLVVHALLEKGANVDAKTKDNYTPLHVAVENGNPSVVETLLGYGANVNVRGGKDGETPLHIAARVEKGQTSAEMLMKSGANVNETMSNGETPLHVAARHGTFEILQSLLNEAADPQIVSSAGNSPLHIAGRYCHFIIAKELLEHVTRTKSRMDAVMLVNWGNNEGETALHYAAELEKSRQHREFEDTDIIKLMLKYDGDMGIQTKYTLETPLHYCARAGNIYVLEEIVQHLQSRLQLAVNKQAKNGWSPLLFASERGHVDIVRKLLQKHARVDMFDEHGMAPLHLAAENGHCEVADVLLEHKAFVNAKSKTGLTPLHLAAQNGYNKLVKLLLEKHNAAIDAVTLNRKTPLHLAAQFGQKLVCETLLKMSGNPNATDSSGQTPLHLAAENDHSEVIKLFLKHKPDLVLLANTHGMTCAHIAAAKGSIAVIKELMKFNRAIITNVRNKTNGSTALHLAAEGGHAKLVTTLLQNGANPHDENMHGMTPLHQAARHGHLEVLEAMRNAMGADKFQTCGWTSQKTGMTPLHVAASGGQIDFVREIISYMPANTKSDPPNTGEQFKDLIAESGLTPLHLACQSGHENLVRLLLNCSGVQVDAATNLHGTIPLHLAAQNGHCNVASLLLSKSSHQIHIKDNRGRTSLHLAAAHGNYDMVALLIGQGAEINAGDNHNWTPLHFTAKAGHIEVVKLLVETGASCKAETKERKVPLAFAAQSNHTDVLGYLLRREHNTLLLMEDWKFLYDMMICAKINNFKTIEEFILLSPAPAETAAKMSHKFILLSEREKERAKDLETAGKYCETMCTDLVAIAANENGAGKLLKSVDQRGVQFLDILIETEQKEVIAHPSVQSYLSEIWKGNLMHMTQWKFIAIFFAFLIPPVWMICSLPLKHRFHRYPVIKFTAYLISHLYLITLYYITAVDPIYKIYDGYSLIPRWPELLLLFWLSGQLVSELTNPADRSGLGMSKILIIGCSAIGVSMHLVAFFYEGNSRFDVLYLRNQFFAVSSLFCFVVILDFLTFHHLFGPWSIIIRNLMVDLIRFLVILAIFMAGFTFHLRSLYVYAYKPIPGSVEASSQKTIFDTFELLFFALFGLIEPESMPKAAVAPYWSHSVIKGVFGVYMVITLIVLINLLIAMMSDTYQRIQAQSDTEWKFGRAKLIRNMNKTSSTPSPLILFTKLIFYVQILYRKKRKLPLYSCEDDWFDDSKKDMMQKTSFLRNMMRRPTVSPGIEHDGRLSAFISTGTEAQSTDPEKIDEVVEWTRVVRRFLAIRMAENGGSGIDESYFAEDLLDTQHGDEQNPGMELA